MLFDEICKQEFDLDEAAKVIWARKKRGDKEDAVRKYRCTSGRRIGRIVNSPADCNKPLDIGRSITTKKNLNLYGKKRARKSWRTKRKSPTSKRIARMNQMMTEE